MNAAARRAAGATLALAASLAGCGRDAAQVAPAAPASPAVPRRERAQLPAALAECNECHARIVRAYAGHAMSDSLGPDLPRALPVTTVSNPASHTTYQFAAGPPGTLHARRADGSQFAAGIMGRLGAGLYDASFVGVRLAPGSAAPTARLQFLPVEQFADGAPALAPFEHGAGVGFDQPVTAECLGCHTTADVAALPDAAAGPSGRIYPAYALGARALDALPPLGCDTCHGDTHRHVAIMRETLPAAPDDIGLARLRDLPAPAQRDVCARCHLDGELRVELAPLAGYGPRDRDLLAERPVLVASAPSRDFRFVSQVERMERSACFRASPGMTCTSCHDPHVAVAAQGTASFDAACQRCHAAGTCTRDPQLAVATVTGAAARTKDGCVDCHVRRSQPYDLEHVRTADHLVRRRIERPETMPLRGQQDAAGGLQVFDDGRLAGALATPEGRRWSAGLVALGLWKLGRPQEAAALLVQFPPPGSAQARVSTAPPGLQPLETSANFHHLRGLVLEAVRRPTEAQAAYGDALALDPAHAEARVNRASLRLDAGDLAGALDDATALLQLYPRAEKGWNLRALAAATAGDLPAACDALRRSIALWPCDAGTWHLLGQLLLRIGQRDAARDALTTAASLDASLPGLAADLAAAGAH